MVAMNRELCKTASILSGFARILSLKPIEEWHSKFVTVARDGSLNYTTDEKGNRIPDFSRVGYYGGDATIPDVAVVRTIFPSADAQNQIQSAIDEVSTRTPDKNGFRGAILLKKGVYKIPGSININTSGI